MCINLGTQTSVIIYRYTCIKIVDCSLSLSIYIYIRMNNIYMYIYGHP